MEHLKASLLGSGGRAGNPLPHLPVPGMWMTLSQPKPQPLLLRHFPLPCHLSPVLCTAVQFSFHIAEDHIPWPFIALVLFNCLFHRGTPSQPYDAALCHCLSMLSSPTVHLPALALLITAGAQSSAVLCLLSPRSLGVFLGISNLWLERCPLADLVAHLGHEGWKSFPLKLPDNV